MTAPTAKKPLLPSPLTITISGTHIFVKKLPRSEDLEAFMKEIGHPTSPAELGLTEEQWSEAFLMAKDIRDKYVLGRLLWDLGDERMHF